METISPVHGTEPSADATPADGFLSRTMRVTRTAAIVVILALLLLEIVLRVMGLASPVLYVDDDATGYRLKPDQKARYLTNAISVNRWGVRDARPLKQKNPNTKRIVVLGDSVTWGGILLHQQELFTSLLEQALTGTEVINAGINGYSVAQMAQLYRSHLTGLDADTILLFAIPRDFVRPIRVSLVRDSVSFPKRKPLFALSTALGGALVELYRRTGWHILEPAPITHEDSPRLSPPEAVAENVRELADLAEAVQGKARLLVVIAPVLSESPAGGPVDTVKDSLAAHAIDFVDLGQNLKAEPSMFADGVHFSKEGHRRVAEALAAYLNETMPSEALAE
ncbi:MAG: SGNH/GDSL hydrolase family protein [Candidatus Hydrogenedentes bacterium]|nr:SGNH/GDSL hydrolase family protein [Candidatus Hydrogenedentota bacterium]